jgi:spore maturation protein CgeB
MRILYVAMKYDYGRKEQGFSFEHCNFYESLRAMGHDVLYFDFMSLLEAHGRRVMNRRLAEVARSERPDLMFAVLFRDEIDAAAVRRVSAAGAPTVSWFCDDVWRFDDLTRHYAPHFDWSVTTSGSALPRYAALGVRHVIKSQYACNHFQYRRLDLPLRHDITFVGQPHGVRRRIIAALRDAGLRVEAWGQGWESGRLSQERMIEVFNQSRINLNLSNTSSAPAPSPPPAARARRLAARTFDALPYGHRLKRSLKEALSRSGPGPAGGSDAAHAGGGDDGGPADLDAVFALPSQIKGRNFEVPGCGGFLLTEPAEELEGCYRDGREVAVFRGLRGLVESARHYLDAEEERAAIARAGRERTLREHTYVHRFTDIFVAVGLPAPPAASLLDGAPRAGTTVEVA